MSFTIFTDTSANLPTKWLKENNISAIPFSYFIDDEECACTDTDEFDYEAYYGEMRKGKMVTTSQINPQKYVDNFEPVLKEGKDIMYIGMSLGSVILGPLADRTEPKKVLAASLTLTGIGCAIMLLFTDNTSVIILAASLGILGFGLGGNAAIFMKVVLSGVPAATAGAGTGTYGLFRDLAAPFGVAVFVPLFTNRVTSIIGSGTNEITAAVNSIKFLAVAEIICVIAGIAIVLFLPKIYIKKGE